MGSRSVFRAMAAVFLLAAGACSNQAGGGSSGEAGSRGDSSSGTSQGGSSGKASSSGGASGGVSSSGLSSSGGTASSGATSSAGAGPGGAISGGSSSSSSHTGGTTGNSSKETGGATGVDGTGGTGGSAGKGGTTGSGGGTGSVTCPTDAETKFSTFLTSYSALQADSKTTDGYGGDLGGLSGADAICQRIAERSSACQKNKTWRAFLSTPTVNARDRIGKGPWYDRIGRLMASNLENLLTERPTGADPAIANDWPNETGIPNHNPDKTGNVDNHEILTGTGVDGKVYTQSTTPGTGGSGGGFPGGFPMGTDCGPSGEAWSVEKATCWGWTTKEPKGCPRVGHSWPRQGSGIGWISVWNESGCAPGGTLTEDFNIDVSSRKVGSAGGYGGFYCFAVTGM